MDKRRQPHSEEHKRKIGIAHLGMKFSEETKKKIKEHHKGMLNLHHSGKTKQKISLSNKGKHNHVGQKNPCWRGGISRDTQHYTKKRRIKKMNAEGSHTLGEWETLKRQYGFKCPACLRNEPEINLTEDHIIPLSKGGSDWIENIQPLCRSCNSRKYTKTFKYPCQ